MSHDTQNAGIALLLSIAIVSTFACASFILKARYLDTTNARSFACVVDRAI